MHQIVFFNGPPRCGKDTVVSQLVPYLNFRHLKFAAPIKREVAALLGITVKELEECKDRQHRALKYYDQGSIIPSYHTPRHLLIHLSEKVYKPMFGDDFFGRIVVEDIRKTAAQLILISDSGFESEFLPVRDEVGRSRCLIIKITREGCTFEGDSRSYLPNGLCKTVGILNDDTIHSLTMRALRIIIKQYNPPLLRDPTWIK